MIGELGWDAWLTAGVVLAMTVLLAREVGRPDMVLLGSLVALLFFGVVPPEMAFAGFSSSAVLSIAALYVVAAGVQRTEALARADRLLLARRGPFGWALFRLMGTAAVLSAFVNNTPLVAILIPRLQRWAEARGISPSKVMIPLSYAAVLGGTATLIGTSTNLVVSGLLKESAGLSIGFFDLTWIGLPAAVVGIAYFALVGHRLLPGRATPARRSSSEEEKGHEAAPSGAARGPFGDGRPYHIELRLGEGSPLVGRSPAEAQQAVPAGAHLEEVHPAVAAAAPDALSPNGPPTGRLAAGDVLRFSATPAALAHLLATDGLERTGTAPDGGAQPPRTMLFEAVLAGTSPLVGRSLSAADFERHYQASVLAVQRRDAPLRRPLRERPLRAGDLLLLEAPNDFHRQHSLDRADFSLVAPYLVAVPARRAQKAPVALALFLGMIGAAALGLLPLVTAAFAAALAMIATGCLRLDEARRGVDVPVLLMIGAAFGIGKTVEETGLAAAIAAAALSPLEALGPMAVLGGVYLVTTVMTELLTNAAAAALVLPVALEAAARLGLDPLPFALAVAVAASAGFATPFGYQTNLMVMGPGGYRFTDFVRAGVPLNLIVMAVALFMLWLVWM